MKRMQMKIVGRVRQAAVAVAVQEPGLSGWLQEPAVHSASAFLGTCAFL